MKAFPGGQSVRHVPVVSIRALARAQGDSSPQTFEVAASSESEVERQGFFTTWREILDHSPGAVQMARFQSGRAGVLVDHDTGDQVGVIDSARIDTDRVLRAVIRFSASQRGQDIERDVVQGIRSNVSIGYWPKRASLVEEDAEKGDLWRITAWEPLEISLVAVPADPTVGVGRGRTTDGVLPVELEGGVQVGNTIEAGRDIRAEAQEIAGMAARSGLQHRAAEWIESGKTPDEVAREILHATRTRGTTAPSTEMPPDLFDGLSQRDRDSYSYARAIRVACGEAEGGVESEVHKALSKAFPSARKGSAHSIMTPMRLSAPRHWTRGALDTKTPTGASEMIFDRPGEMVELFRAQSMVIGAGARVLTGLVGNIQFVKQTGAATVYWVPENPGVDVTESELTTGLVTGSPKTMQGTTVYSRQFLVQAPSSGIDGENLVREDLAKGHALAFDRAALHGKGAAGEPTGIYVSGDVLVSASMAVPDWTKLVTMAGQIADANAPTSSLKWMTTPLMAAKLKTILVASASSSDFIWTGPFENGEVAGYPAMATNQVRKDMGAGSDEHGIILADWTQVLLMTWNSLELVIDPYARKKQGLIEVTSFQMGDVVLRQPTAICRALGAKIA